MVLENQIRNGWVAEGSPLLDEPRKALARYHATTSSEGAAERWIVDQRDWGPHFLKTASGAVVHEGLTQQQACRMANEHNGDQEYPKTGPQPAATEV